MICAIHQPNFIPYIGLFKKIQSSDIFVIYDTAQYTKGDFHNRNTILGPNGKILLSLPVSVKFGEKIRDVTFDSRILGKFWRTIEQCYNKAPYFEKNREKIEKIFCYNGNNLAEYNIYGITLLCEILNIKTEIVLSSELELNTSLKSTDALIGICKKLSADTYLSGDGGKNYLEEEKFQVSEIQLQYQNFSHPTYKQRGEIFTPYMSIIDCIFYNDGILG